MARTLQEIEKDVRSLHASERNQLLRELIADVDGGESDEDIEGLWLREAQQRYREIQNGTVTPIPAEEVIQKARSRLKREG